MKLKLACSQLLAVFSLALVAFGSDSWLHKPSSVWSEKEVRKILENSPWAHRVKLMVVNPPPGKTPCATKNRPCNAEGDPDMSTSYPGPRRPGAIDPSQPRQEKRSNAELVPGLEGVAAASIVRWASARTIREAMARNAVQRGAANPGESPNASRLPPVGPYVVYVDLRIALADVPKVPKSGVFTSAIARNSVLVLKATGERISPVSVQTAPLPEFDERKELALGAYYIIFPREIGGKPSLPGSEVRLRFECPTVPVPITAEFDLHKMSREGSPDL